MWSFLSPFIQGIYLDVEADGEGGEGEGEEKPMHTDLLIEPLEVNVITKRKRRNKTAKNLFFFFSSLTIQTTGT
jgi:hypothetical protein